MSHYTVMTILRKGSNKTLEDILAPYDENLEVAPYVRSTKAELIQEMRERAACIVSDRAIVASVKDKEEYLEKDTHYSYAYVISDAAKAIAALVDATDEEVFEAVKRECGDSLDALGAVGKGRMDLGRLPRAGGRTEHYRRKRRLHLDVQPEFEMGLVRDRRPLGRGADPEERPPGR